MTVTTLHFQPILLCDGLDSIPIGDGLFLQLLPDIAALAGCARNTQAAFIKDHGMLVVWGDSPNQVLERASEVEERVIGVFSRGMEAFAEIVEETENEAAAKAVRQKRAQKETKSAWKFWKAADVTVDEVDSEDLDAEDQVAPPRKTVLVQAVLCALTLMLIIAALASGWRKVVIEIVIDKKWIRLAFLVVMPLQIWLALVSSSDLAHVRASS